MTTDAHAHPCSTANWLAFVSTVLHYPLATNHVFFADCAMTRILDFAAPLGQKAGRGHWNDLDMLEIGNGGMTFDEYGMSISPDATMLRYDLYLR